MVLRVAPIDVFNNCGTLSSFGFVLAYMLIAVAAAVYLRRLRAMHPVDLGVSVIAFVLLLMTAITLFYPVPPPPQRWFGYAFVAFLVIALAATAIRRSGRPQR
jgi:amino acid transporter